MVVGRDHDTQQGLDVPYRSGIISDCGGYLVQPVVCRTMVVPGVVAIFRISGDWPRLRVGCVSIGKFQVIQADQRSTGLAFLCRDKDFAESAFFLQCLPLLGIT
ncbi:hypothetical protein D3C80_1404750 [compost metagenome]